jgi:hypothetical protein
LRLSETEKYPWDEKKVLSRDHQQLADYLKNLIKKLNDVYVKIANAVNQNIDIGIHHLTHEDGGIDEISVLGLSGLLADSQTPLVHKTSHQNGGSDEISVAGLSGELADPQTAGSFKELSSDPGAPSEGDIWYNTTDHKYKGYNGSEIVLLG